MAAVRVGPPPSDQVRHHPGPGQPDALLATAMIPGFSEKVDAGLVRPQPAHDHLGEAVRLRRWGGGERERGRRRQKAAVAAEVGSAAEEPAGFDLGDDRSASPAYHARTASRLRPQASSCGSPACRAQVMPSAASGAARRKSPRWNAGQAAPSSTRALMPGSAAAGTLAAAVRNWPASLYRPVAIHHRASRTASSPPASGSWPPSAHDNAARMLSCSADRRLAHAAHQGRLRCPGLVQRPFQQPQMHGRLLAGGGQPASGELADGLQQRITDHSAVRDVYDGLAGQAGQQPGDHLRPQRPAGRHPLAVPRSNPPRNTDRRASRRRSASPSSS